MIPLPASHADTPPSSTFRRIMVVCMLSTSLALTACGEKPGANNGPQVLPAGAACALDGMLLADYPGPKGQIQYVDGKLDAFCDTVELVSMLKQPETATRVAGAYVQDIGKTPWEKPVEHWIDANQAWFVVGSKRLGSMGPTFASFAERADADAFAKQFGGKVLTLAQITPDMARLDGGVLHDTGM